MYMSNPFAPSKFQRHPVIDGMAFLFFLLLALVVDLTKLPELPAVLAYEIMLLAAVAAIFHLAYVHRHKND